MALKVSNELGLYANYKGYGLVVLGKKDDKFWLLDEVWRRPSIKNLFKDIKDFYVKYHTSYLYFNYSKELEELLENLQSELRKYDDEGKLIEPESNQPGIEIFLSGIKEEDFNISDNLFKMIAAINDQELLIENSRENSKNSLEKALNKVALMDCLAANALDSRLIALCLVFGNKVFNWWEIDWV